MNKKFANFWYYNKVYIFIGLAVIAVVIYSFVSAAKAREEQAQYDYCVGIVSPTYYDDADLEALAEALSAIYGNTQICSYHLEIGGTGQSEIEVCSLDLDIISDKSQAFLVDDPETFIEVVDAEFNEPVKVSEIPELSGLGFDELSFVTYADY